MKRILVVFAKLFAFALLVSLASCIGTINKNPIELIAPKNGETNLSFNNLSFEFSVRTTGDYDLIIRDDKGDTVYKETISRVSGKVSHTVPAGKLRPGTSYRWYVRRAGTDSIASEMWRFKTRNNSAPVLSNPKPDKLYNEPFGALALTWDANDPDNDVLKFEVKVYRKGESTPVFNKVFNDPSGVVKDLEQLTEYEWTVVAIDPWGAKSNELRASFKTKENEPPQDIRLVEPEIRPGQRVRFNNLKLKWEGVDPDREDLLYTVTITGANQSRALLNFQKDTESAVDLKPSTNYVLEIEATDKYGKSLKKTFNFTTVDNSAPEKPTLKNPSNNEKINVKRFSSIDFQWDAVSDPDDDVVMYKIVIKRGNLNVEERNGLTTTTYSVSLPSEKFRAGERYTWYVEAYDKWGGVRRSDEYSFELYSNSPPSKPMSPNPSNGAKNLPNRIRFSWYATDEDGDKLLYDFYVGDSPSNLKLEASNLESPEYLRPVLFDYSKTYYWKVVVKDGDMSVEGDVWSFTITSEDKPPTVPELLGPPNGATGLKFNNLKLSWKASQDDKTARDKLEYIVVLGEADSMAVVGTVTGVSTDVIDFVISNLKPLTRYYWRVEVKDSFNNFAYSQTWTFTTKVNTSPKAPYNPSPADGSVLRPGAVQFAWQSRDEDEDTLTYELRIAKTPEALESATPIIRNTENYTAEINEEGTYYWRVTAKDPHGGQASSTWTFTIQKP
ncbi:fibronectin type III domain-containing protein [Fervidobacterium thailandense]|uniref:Fibronectin type-III domain-containing protein n=1 Tax=Fervidobacterium thailandense TaxID=1008305 RepID=A0A1E3G4V8_9BACT|nr:fibronectin type III domain-containing protein [Fervidobacterium thailandense]ODN31287.1 hypothetical protein A4H02_00460 [Fervidobacterium thailandense]